MKRFEFQAKTAKGGASLLLYASALLLLCLLALVLFREWLPATLWALLLLACGVALVLAYARLTEPWLVLEATEQGLTYFHRKGQWHLPWQECVFVTVPELNGRELSYVGIRLKQQSPFLSRLTPRLAVAILMEQRNLLLSALGQNCPTGQCPSSFLLETDPCQAEGKVYKGVIGMFGHRMQTLRQLIGFELYIPLNALSENPQLFCRTINQLRLQYAENTVT